MVASVRGVKIVEAQSSEPDISVCNDAGNRVGVSAKRHDYDAARH